MKGSRAELIILVNTNKPYLFGVFFNIYVKGEKYSISFCLVKALLCLA